MLKWRRSKDKLVIEGDLEIEQFLDAVDEAKAILLALQTATREHRRAVGDYNRAAARLEASSDRAERASIALKRAHRSH